MNDWKNKETLAEMKLNLQNRRQRLQALGQPTEAALDAALGRDDYETALHDMALAGLEAEILNRALARIDALQRDIVDRERNAERNRRRAELRARGGPAIMS